MKQFFGTIPSWLFVLAAYGLYGAMRLFLTLRNHTTPQKISLPKEASPQS